MVFFLTVFSLLHLYIYKRLIKKLELHNHVKQTLNIFLILNSFGVIGYMLARYYPLLPNWLYFLLSLPIGFIFLLFCTTLIYDISSFILKHTPLEPNRRAFFKRSLDISSLGIAFALSSKAIYEARFVEVQEVKIKLNNLKKDYTIAQLSDVHIGGLIDADFIRGLVEKINILKPDLVVITGDLVDVKIEHAMIALKELRHLKSVYGTYFIVGNHEYFHDIEEIIKTLKGLDIVVLENSSVYIGKPSEGFFLAGVYDIFGYRAKRYIPDINKALSQTHTDVPTVLLAHQPKFVTEVEGTPVDLMLSGHTHGGQLYPFHALVKLQQPYIRGLHQHNEKLQVYVNKGTGFWGPPMRLGATAEITHITLSS
jgi:predicted MPP superfamily phosphohydrolase